MPNTLNPQGSSPRYWPGADGAPELLGRSPAITRVHELVRRAAVEDDGCVLITAETGTAAESVAAALHGCGPRSAAPFVVVDCTMSHAGRLEHTLFGPKSLDAPTDLEFVSAESRIAMARGGTLFLQHVNELPAALQTRLSRVVRDGQMRVDRDPQPAAFRLVASAPRGIENDVHTHRFRADLYRRLTTMRIDMPALRERVEDVPLLANQLLHDLCAAEGLAVRTFNESALALLGALTWPGNLAELHDVIADALRNRQAAGAVIQIEHLLPALRLHQPPVPFVPAGNLREARSRFERDYIAAVLQHHRWRMADAAQTLGIQRPNLYRKARQLGIPLARVPD